ncbi:MAG: hypothetical protein LBG64_00205 [Pseudomonadales bacterium]|nr:hypothetical protein [Pseudomonadales bacterium]
MYRLDFLNAQNKLAEAIKEVAEENELHGTCCALMLPKDLGDTPKDIMLVSKNAMAPSFLVFGGSYEDWLEIDAVLTRENFIGVTFCKLAKMVESGQDSEIPFADGQKALGEEDFMGGKIYETDDRFVLVAMSSNKPKQNNGIVDGVVQKWLAESKRK